jgi:teichuronic acid biosynthesis glycosyltransferase TuaG
MQQYDFDRKELVSIIMPAYNSDRYIAASIDSILKQTYTQWELLVINDGSVDRTKNIILGFLDPRIRYFEQSNKGVSAARNVGLSNMRGNYFCFLDADDIFSPQSLDARMKVFQHSSTELEFVDGSIEIVDDHLNLLRVYKPHLQNRNPFDELIALRNTCYLKQSWLIKRRPEKQYVMKENLTHGEDLFFSMEISRYGGLYDYTENVILLYRQHESSAMRNLEGLNGSYNFIFQAFKHWPEVSGLKRFNFLIKARKIMFLSFLVNGKSVLKAFRSLIRWQ